MKIISVANIVVNYDSDSNKWITILDKLKNDIPIISDDFRTFASSWKTVSNGLTADGWVSYAKSIGNTDKELLKFLADVDKGDRNIADIDDYMASAANSSTKFGAALKSAAVNMGIMLAVSLAIKGVIALWDKLNLTVAEAQESLDKRQATITDLKTQIEELESIDANALTQGQKDKLQNLKDQLKVQEQLEEIEKRRLAREKLGTGNWTDVFDKDSYAYAKGKIANSINDYQLNETKFHYLDNFAEQQAYINDFMKIIEEAQANGAPQGYIDGISKTLEKAEAKQQKNSEQLSQSYDGLLSTQAEILNQKTVLQDLVDGGYLYGSDLTYAITELKNLGLQEEIVESEMKRLIETMYGGDDSWKSVLAEKSKYSVENLLGVGFSEEELKVLATLEFDKEATISELRELLNSLSDEAKSNTSQVSFGDIFANEDADGKLTNLGKISESIDTIQNAYKTLSGAVDEYNNTGAISIDTLQSVTALGDGWLDYLVDEQGNLKLDKEALQDLTASRLEDMRMQTINNLINNVKKIEDDITAKQYLISTNYEAVESYEALAEASLAAAKVQLGSAVDAGTLSQANMDAVLNKASADIAKINTLFDNTDISFSSIMGEDKTKSAQSKAEKSWKDYLDKCINVYEKELELGLMDYDDFIKKSRKLMEDFYKDGKISAEEYWESIEDLYERQLDIYDKVLNAVERRFDKEIEKVQDLIDGLEDQNDALEKQIDDYDRVLSVVDTVYDDQIKALEDEKDLLQDKIDAINDEADAYELVRRKEEALYALEQAQKNRTKKLYVEDRGYIYDTDHEAIREAQDEVHDIKNEEVIRKLEKEQEAIDKSIEILEEYKKLWGSVSDAYETEINRQLAVALWGEEYESVILSNRIEDITAFKDQYIAAQQQIDDNQSLIDSYNEKIEYYEALKQQWSDIANAYEESIEDQYAAMVLGEDWEHTILDERNGLMENFKNKYIEIQEQITQAARSSAEAQKQAAQDALDAAETLGGVKIDKTKPEKKYKVVDADGNTVSSGYSSKEAANEYIVKAPKNIPKNRNLKVVSYSKGGVVSNKGQILTELAKSVGEDQMVAVKTGERILTAQQNKSWEELTKNLSNIIFATQTLKEMAKPDYVRYQNLERPNVVQNIDINYNISMPNVHDGTKADEIVKAIQRLPLDAYQFSKKRW